MIPVARVICPVDRSPASRQALHHAFALARRYDAQLRVLHVVPPPVPTTAPGPGGVVLARRLTSTARDEIAQVVEETRNPGVAVEIDILEGHPADVILDVVTRDTHALVVMGTHGRTGVTRMLIGSVTERVARKTTQPLLVVPPHDETAPAGAAPAVFARILCAVDLRASSLSALRAALALSRENDAVLDMVSVLDMPPEDEARRTASTAHMAQRAEACTTRLRAMHDLVPDDARQACWVFQHVRAGEPAQELLAYAREASSDLIVIGAGDDRHLGTSWLGRTADRLMRGASCPVLVVPVVRIAHARRTVFLPPETWASELARLTEQHQGAPTTVAIMTDVIGPQTEAKALPLRALTAERNNERGSIVVILGESDQVHLTHFVSRPIEVRLGESDTARTNVELLITDEDGTTTVVDVNAI